METTKIFCFVKDDGAVGHNRVTKWFKKFHSDCKNLYDQARSEKPKTVESETRCQTIEANPVSKAWRVSR